MTDISEISCLGCQESKFFQNDLVPFYQEFPLLTSAFLISVVLNY